MIISPVMAVFYWWCPAGVEQYEGTNCLCEFRDRDSYLNDLSKHCLLFKYLSSVYYEDRKIGTIKSQEIDFAVMIFLLKAVQPTPCIVLPEAFSVVNLLPLK